jgi:AcrR family transcriptional regulator
MAIADSRDEQRLTAKGRATRERILVATAEMILNEGLSELSMDKVRKEASVSGSQLSHYYADKQSLIREVLNRQIEVVLDFHRQPKLGGLDTFEDFERWIDLNLRYLRRIGFGGTATYHALTGRLAKSDEATRQTLAAGYERWFELLEESFQRMKDRGVLKTNVKPRELALIVVAIHQGGAILAFAYRQEWPLADALRFVVNYLRTLAADQAERQPRPPRRRGSLRAPAAGREETQQWFTRKGWATRARVVEGAAELMFHGGLSGTSLSDVRNALGLSGSQLTHYFADKRDLTRQVIASRTSDIIDFHGQRMGSVDSFKGLRAWADACAAESEAVYLRGGCIYGSLTGELLEADDGMLDDLAAGYERWLGVIQDGIAAMRARGDLTPKADPRHLSVALLAAHQGGAMLTFVTADADYFRAVINAAVDYVGTFRPAPKKRTRQSASRRKGNDAEAD